MVLYRPNITIERTTTNALSIFTNYIVLYKNVFTNIINNLMIKNDDILNTYINPKLVNIRVLCVLGMLE